MTDWDARYAEPGYAYGTEPNDFLAEVAGRIPPGPVLSLGEGEGRNAVFLAGLGHAVTAVDASAVGLAKAAALASGRGVRIAPVVADLDGFPIAPNGAPQEAQASVAAHHHHVEDADREGPVH